MIRVFGPAAYAEIMQLPPRLIARAAQINGERDAEARLATLSDLAIGAGLKFGQKYVDPKNPSGKAKRGEAFYSLDPFNRHSAALERLARPWEHTPARVRARREAEEERRMQALEKALGGQS